MNIAALALISILGMGTTTVPAPPKPAWQDPTYLSAYNDSNQIDRIVEIHKDGSYKCLVQPSEKVLLEMGVGASLATYISLCGRRLP